MATGWQLRQLFVVEAGVNRRFRDPVAIDDAHLSTEALLQVTIIAHTAAIRAGDQQLHAAHVQSVLMHMLHERHDQSRRRFEYRNLIIPNPAVQSTRIDPVVLRADDHRAAIVEGARDIPDEHVKGEARQLEQPHREFAQSVIPSIRRCRIHQTAMLNHDALRTSGCTGGVDHIR